MDRDSVLPIGGFSPCPKSSADEVPRRRAPQRGGNAGPCTQVECGATTLTSGIHLEKPAGSNPLTPTSEASIGLAVVELERRSGSASRSGTVNVCRIGRRERSARIPPEASVNAGIGDVGTENGDKPAVGSADWAAISPSEMPWPCRYLRKRPYEPNSHQLSLLRGGSQKIREEVSCLLP